MKIIVDKNLCSGHARCNALAPELFPVDDDGYSDVTDPEVPTAMEDQAHLAAESCPERAIALAD